jgi:hypothetical protein
MQFHPLTEIFPLLRGEPFEELIKARLSTAATGISPA